MYLAFLISLPAFGALGWVVRWIVKNETGTFAEGFALGLFGALAISMVAKWDDEMRRLSERPRDDFDSPDR
jgi:hypothetical protein